MGRGRAKAKQTKVARELKYRSVSTDFASLEEELRSSSGTDIPPAYADLAQEYSEGEELADPEEDGEDEYSAYLDSEDS
ncbi:MAG: DUF3073 domain-containing protein [Propionibacteriaceae bacterium]|jgi:hypothetical protein|nr:DUF3073 domain-containing protein [Propionibacteriaceae bacterium]